MKVLLTLGSTLAHLVLYPRMWGHDHSPLRHKPDCQLGWCPLKTMDSIDELMWYGELRLICWWIVLKGLIWQSDFGFNRVLFIWQSLEHFNTYCLSYCWILYIKEDHLPSLVASMHLWGPWFFHIFFHVTMPPKALIFRYHISCSRKFVDSECFKLK